MREYEVLAIDSDGYEICQSVEANLKDAKIKAKYFVSDDYIRRSGLTDIFKSEVRVHGKTECLFDTFRSIKSAES